MTTTQQGPRTGESWSRIFMELTEPMASHRGGFPAAVRFAGRVATAVAGSVALVYVMKYALMFPPEAWVVD